LRCRRALPLLGPLIAAQHVIAPGQPQIGMADSLERPCGHSPGPTWDSRAIPGGGAQGLQKATGEASLTLNAAAENGTLAAGRAALPR